MTTSRSSFRPAAGSRWIASGLSTIPRPGRRPPISTRPSPSNGTGNWPSPRAPTAYFLMANCSAMCGTMSDPRARRSIQADRRADLLPRLRRHESVQQASPRRIRLGALRQPDRHHGDDRHRRQPHLLRPTILAGLVPCESRSHFRRRAGNSGHDDRWPDRCICRRRKGA